MGKRWGPGGAGSDSCGPSPFQGVSAFRALQVSRLPEEGVSWFVSATPNEKKGLGGGGEWGTEGFSITTVFITVVGTVTLCWRPGLWHTVVVRRLFAHPLKINGSVCTSWQMIHRWWLSNGLSSSGHMGLYKRCCKVLFTYTAKSLQWNVEGNRAVS